MTARPTTVSQAPGGPPSGSRDATRDDRRPVPTLTVVPTEAELRAFDRFLAEWIAEAAHRRLQRAAGR